MVALILSAAPRDHAPLRELVRVAESVLARAGHEEVREIELAGNHLGYCQGEFDCWLRTPGTCKIADGEQAIVAAMHDAEVVVFLGPVVFGGHDPDLKRAIDRSICLIDPFFEKRKALTHHVPRYAKRPSMFALGWMHQADADEIRTWDALLDANAVNMCAPLAGSVVVTDADEPFWFNAVEAMIECAVEPGIGIDGRAPLRGELLDAAAPEDAPLAPPVRRVAILIGSAKPKGTSASEALAAGLAAHMAVPEVEIDRHYATTFAKESLSAVGAAQAIAAADLFVLSTPLYVDAFPSLVVRALQFVARLRKKDAPLARFVPIVNCGFPEPEHIRTALRIARSFARRADYVYGGGLPLGGGGTIVGRSLEDPRGPAIHVSHALALAAPELMRGGSVPEAALAAMLERPMPDALYRFAGDMGFRWIARGLGTPQRALRARPLDR